MVRKLYGTSVLKYENTEEILEYYILKHCIEDDLFEIGKPKLEMYGIEIRKKGKDAEEKSFISDLTVNKKDIEEIAKKIKDNIVTPVHLYDVLENFIF